jgi:hypothetical protein
MSALAESRPAAGVTVELPTETDINTAGRLFAVSNIRYDARAERKPFFSDFFS